MSGYSEKELYEEIRLKNSILVEGLSFEPGIFKNLDLGHTYVEGVNALFAQDKEAHRGIEFPSCFLTPKGNYQVRIRWFRDSRYTLEYEDGQYNIYERGSKVPVVENVRFKSRSAYYDQKTSDGTSMRTIAQDNGYGVIFIVYSNECSLKDKGLDCLFCNINATRAIYAEAQGISWRSPKQIGETVAAAYKEGFHKLTVSGGFVPERREVDYYIDVAEAIADATGLADFNGTACVGAPTDLSVFEKYKEAGFRTIATNMEVWNEKLFEYICPGKSQLCGGRQNWLDALREELNVFGRFKVRSTFVSGLETRESLLSGISYLVNQGVVAFPSQWYVNVGSAFEGHRTPEDAWHFDVAERTVDIYRSNGLTWEELRDATAESDSAVHDLFRLKEGITLDEKGNWKKSGTKK
ncbi:MAG: nitrogen fixation protein NifB [Lachnospiraceae bacterium]|nr:nitrogen fixation protein NifB [Lachnospiraceae bacterium]